MKRRALPKRAGDLEKLLLADGQLARALVDVDIETPDVELLARPAAGARAS